MRDRAFGVEIECGYDGPCSPRECEGGCHCENCCECGFNDDNYGVGCQVAADLLSSNGFSHWTNEIHEDGSGVEIPSPILHGRAGLEELKSVMGLLYRNGFYAGSEDGLHVHHDAPEFAEDESLVVRLVEMWEENLPVIDRFVHSYRRGGRHWACNSYKDSMSRYYDDSDNPWAEFKRNKSLDTLYRDKFRSLNVTSLGEHGTIEFRLHEGTLDFDKASAWIHFGQSLLETAKRRKTIFTCAEPSDLLRITRTSKASTRTLLRYAAAA